MIKKSYSKERIGRRDGGGGGILIPNKIHLSKKSVTKKNNGKRVNSSRRSSNDKCTCFQHQSTHIYEVCIDRIEREIDSNTIVGVFNTPLSVMYSGEQKISNETDH